MIVFKKRNESIYLVTNYKVMFSTLSNQENLVRLNPGKKLLLKALASWLRPRFKSEFYFVVRNPFDRILSFYKSKFLNAEKNRLWMLENEKENKWQPCTEYFFPFLNLDINENPREVSSRLVSTKFNQVISILPFVLMHDGHMYPQYLSRKIGFRFYGKKVRIPVRFNRIFKMEDQKDLQEIARIFDIDLSMKRNSTNDITDRKWWDSISIEAVRRMYNKDFKYFQYPLAR